MNKRIFTNINLCWVFQISATVSLIIIFLFQWGIMITTPSLRTGTDFISFYSVGQISREHGFSSAYNIDFQREVQEALIGFDLAEQQVLLYLHMPYLLPVLYLLVNTDYIGSFIRWDFLMLGIYLAGSIYFLKGIVPAENIRLRKPLLLGMFTFVPFFHSLVLGQDTPLLFLGISLWCLGILKKQDQLTVAGLLLSTVRPHICLPLAIPLFFRYRKAWWFFSVFAGLLALTSILIIGWKGTLNYINLLQISANGIWFGTSDQAMVNLTGLIVRLYPLIDLETLSIVRWSVYTVGILALCVLWIKADEIDARLLGMTIVVVLLIAPHLYYHDLTLLIIPLVFMTTIPIRGIPSERLALLPLGVSILLIPEPFQFIVPYILYIVMFWILAKSASIPDGEIS